MGIVYDGPYRDLIGPHEGYVIACNEGGTRIGDAIWFAYEDAAHHLEARCAECGWMGTLHHPVSEAGEEAGHQEWRDHHIQPLIDKAAGSWPGWAEQVAALARAVAAYVSNDRPADAVETLDLLERRVAERRRIAEELAQEKK